MKIAIYHNLPSGGAKRALYEHILRLRKTHGLDLYNLSTSEEEFSDLRSFVDQVFTYRFELKNLPAFSQGYNFLFSLKSLEERIASDIDSKDYDLVFVHHCQFIQSPHLLRFLKTPTLYYCQEPRRPSHEYQPESLPSKGIRSWIGGRLLAQEDTKNARSADLVLVNSYFSAESIYRAYGIEARVCYLGVSTEKFRSLKDTRKTKSVVSVGAVHPTKGFDFLIRSLSLLPQKERPKLIVIGDRWDQNYMAQLKQLARSQKVPLEILTRIGEERLVKLYNQALLTLCAAHLEPFGFTPLESMACGTPVVSVKEGGYRESVKEGGILVDRDERKFAATVRKLLASRALREKMGKRGRVYVQKSWDWENSTRTLESFFPEISLIKKGAAKRLKPPLGKA